MYNVSSKYNLITIFSLSKVRRIKYTISSDLGDIIDGAKDVYTEPSNGPKGNDGFYYFYLTPTMIKAIHGTLVFTGTEMIKINNPDYDSGL